jgi:hypothetical protein
MNFLQIIFTLTIFFLFAPTVLAQTTVSQLDIPALVSDCQRNLRQCEGVHAETNHSFFDKSGELKKEEVETFETYPTRNRQSLVLVKLSENGVPLLPEKIAAERKRAIKQIEEAERQKKANLNRKTRTKAVMFDSGFSNFLQVGEFSNPRQV